MQQATHRLQGHGAPQAADIARFSSVLYPFVGQITAQGPEYKANAIHAPLREDHPRGHACEKSAAQVSVAFGR